MKQLPIVVLKGCPYVGVSLCSLHMPSGFGGRAGYDVNTSEVFPQGVLAAITLVGGRAEDGGGSAGARCELGFPFCLVVLTALSGAEASLKLLEQMS